ncbi:MAG: dephospho-CoA kinase [Sphingobacteriaceae bacterium]|nr:dephospho-CoA kinase [Sphingobacteriaceae bacterium]
MIVGLTGGIGTGKSTVAKLFELLGAKTFNSDENAKQQYFVPAIKQQVIDLLGKECYADERTLNRKFISTKIFSDTTLLKKLNAIIHPAVIKDFRAFANSYPGKLIIKESALLFEVGLIKELDKVILVTSPLELRIERVMKRDNLSREEIMNKIKSQLSDEEKLKLTDLVIRNDEKEFLITQTLAIFNKLNHV